MSMDKLTAYGTIVCAVCAPLALFFTAAAFFQWKPETFSNLGIMSIPVGTAIIVLLLGVFPWLLVILSYRYSHKISAGQQDNEAAGEVQKMREGIQNVIGQLTEVCHQINSHKGTPGVPVNNCYELFNPIQDQIQRPIISQLKSLLPKENKDG